jgi:hypothetical protein
VKEIILTLKTSSEDLLCSLRTELESHKIGFEEAARSLSLKKLIAYKNLDWMQEGVVNGFRFNEKVLKDLM